MNKEDIAILEIEFGREGSSGKKNRFISDHRESFLGITDPEVFKGEKLEELLESGELPDDMEVLVICTDESEALFSMNIGEYLACGLLPMVAIVFKRGLLVHSGRYNEKLLALEDEEFVSRLLKKTDKGYCLFLPLENKERSVNEHTFFSYAYILRNCLPDMVEEGDLERALTAADNLSKETGMKSSFSKALDEMMETEVYENINAETAPILVLFGDEQMGYGVLHGFASALSAALIDLGEAVQPVISGEMNYDRMEQTLYKAIIGFQSGAFINPFFANLKGKKVQFWLDQPVFNQAQIEDMPKDCLFLCQDATHVSFIRNYYGFDAMLLPPGGFQPNVSIGEERIYDISFLGTYQKPFDGIFREEEQKFYNYMIAHCDETFFDGMCKMTKEEGTYVSNVACAEQVRALKHVCQHVINYYKDKVLHAINDGGYKIHVYGETWDAYPDQEGLIRHPAVMSEDALLELAKAKIGLNIMSWHKAGLTERVLNIMMAGSACLTDFSSGITDCFENGEEVICFGLDEIDRIPAQIENLLINDRWKQVGKAGRRKVLKEHTWSARAGELLSVISNEEYRQKEDENKIAFITCVNNEAEY